MMATVNPENAPKRKKERKTHVVHLAEACWEGMAYVAYRETERMRLAAFQASQRPSSEVGAVESQRIGCK